MSTDTPQHVRLAVVQPALELGEVERNLARIEDLIRDAHREHHADAILVPEGCSSPNVYSRKLLNGPRPVDGQPFQLLTRLARELGCVIGGGALAVRGRHAYGTYVLAEPDGRAHLHDKDIPTAWEQHYYKGGDDPGVTRIGAFGDTTVGVMSGWEWARHRTSRRVRDAGAQLVLGGMCWPSFPTNWGPLNALCRREHRIWKEQARALPGQVARIVGAPVAHASHVGPITGETPLVPGLSWPTTMIGESQVCDRDGTILARLSEEDGEGHVSAVVSIEAPQPVDPSLDRFWIPDMTVMTNIAWHGMNAHGNLRYRLRHARNQFPWQGLPSGDLPDEIPAHEPHSVPMATS